MGDAKGDAKGDADVVYAMNVELLLRRDEPRSENVRWSEYPDELVSMFLNPLCSSPK
jgi:hypothetical protein